MLDKSLVLIELEKGKSISNNNCWNWKFRSSKGKNNGFGYGKLIIDNKQYLVHRLSAWIYLNFDLNSELFVCHKCDNTLCFNPEHLFIGTNKDNSIDMCSKKRHVNNRKTHCPQGHEYTNENTYRPNNENNRKCRICLYNGMKKWRNSKKGQTIA